MAARHDDLGLLDPRRWRARLVIDTNRQRRVLGLVQGFGDHDRDRLAEKPDLVVLQDVQPLAVRRIDEALLLPVRKSRRVLVGDDREHARHVGGRRVDPAYPPKAHRARDDDGIGLAGLVELGGVAGKPGDLGGAVDPRQGLADRHGAHAGSPVIARARTTVRRSSSTLK